MTQFLMPPGASLRYAAMPTGRGLIQRSLGQSPWSRQLRFSSEFVHDVVHRRNKGKGIPPSVVSDVS
eukprot:11179893-Lingulodinium_polyedra.AAC.1